MLMTAAFCTKCKYILYRIIFYLAKLVQAPFRFLTDVVGAPWFPENTITFTVKYKDSP